MTINKIPEVEPLPQQPHLPGLKILLLGDAGTGKTRSLFTLVEAGYEVFALFTEPCMDVVADIPSDKLHWNYISPSSAPWATLLDSAKKINTMDMKSLASLPHVNRGKHAELLQVYTVLSNFVDQRTGKEYGPVDNLTTKQVLWIDSFSGLSTMAMNLVAGTKPMKCVADYGISMSNLEFIVQKLCNDLATHVVVVGHLEREKDEISGANSLMISTIGNKLAPKLPALFTDVIHTKRINTEFVWSTVTPNTTLKARNLPWADKMPPTFAPLLKHWEEQNEKAFKSTGEKADV